MLRGGGADAQRGPVFWWDRFLGRPRWSEVPRLSGRAFCGFPHRFRDFCVGFGCLRRSFGPCGPSASVGGPSARRGPKTPREAPRPPPSLRLPFSAVPMPMNLMRFLARTREQGSSGGNLPPPPTWELRGAPRTQLWTVMSFIFIFVCFSS